MALALALALLLLLPLAEAQPYSIEDYGAISGVDTHAQALKNGAALAAAVAAANASATRRSVLIPASKVYSFLPAVQTFDSLTSVTIYIEGTLNVSTAGFWEGNGSGYPGFPDSPWNPLRFTSCDSLSLVSTTGKGVLNGRGNLWWWYTVRAPFAHGRRATRCVPKLHAAHSFFKLFLPFFFSPHLRRHRRFSLATTAPTFWRWTRAATWCWMA